MQISNVSSTGVFSGIYETPVSDAASPFPPSPLQGVQAQGRQPVFGLIINWNFTGRTSYYLGWKQIEWEEGI